MDLPNPIVAAPDGSRLPLWTHLPETVLLLGLRRNPLRDIHLGTTEFWESLATSYVYLIGPEQDFPPPPPGVLVVADLSGELEAWCSRQGGDWVVVCPDRRVFGVYAAEDAPFAAADLQAALAGAPPPQRPAPPPGAAATAALLVSLASAVIYLAYRAVRRRSGS